MLKLHSAFFDDMLPGWRKDEAPTEHDILILVMRGNLTYRLNGRPIPLEKGDCLFVPYGMLRAGVNGPDGPHQKYSAHFRIDRPEQFPLPDAHSFCKIRSNSPDYMLQRFVALAQQWHRRMPHYETICHGIVVEMLGLLAQETEMRRYSPAKRQLVRDVQDYILAHFRETVRIDELARLTGRTPNYITRTFKEVTGLTPIAYVHSLRLQTARILMATTQLSIGEISDYLGYSDQSHFNRVFKKLLGFPPSTAYFADRADGSRRRQR